MASTQKDSLFKYFFYGHIQEVNQFVLFEIEIQEKIKVTLKESERNYLTDFVFDQLKIQLQKHSFAY